MQNNNKKNNMRSVWAAIQICETVEGVKKYYAYATKITECDNAIYKLQIKNIIAATLCTTKKRAFELVNAWRDSFKANNEYMF